MTMRVVFHLCRFPNKRLQESHHTYACQGRPSHTNRHKFTLVSQAIAGGFTETHLLTNVYATSSQRESDFL